MRLRSSLKMLLGLALHGLDSVLLAALPRRTQGDGAPTLLLVRMDRIGDMVIWLPTAHRLVEDYRARGFRVVPVVGAECADLAGGIPGVEAVIAVDRDRFRLRPVYRAATLRRVREVGATEAVQPAWSRIPALGDAIVRFSGAARRVAWMGDAASTSAIEKRLGDGVYTELLHDPAGTATDLERNERFLDRLGIPALPFDRTPLPRALFKAVDLPDRFYALVPGASQGLRRWPSDRFARIAGMLHGRTGWTGVICGGGGDRPLADAIRGEAAVPLIDLTGQTSLPELADVIGRSALLVSNDTAAVHVAAAVGTPSVCVLGGGTFGRFMPYPASRLVPLMPPAPVHVPMDCYGCDWNCRYRVMDDRTAPCVEAVSVEAVWAAVTAALDGG